MYILAVNLFGSLADIMSRAYGPALAISGMIGTLMALFVIQDKPYKVLGLFVTRKFKRAEHNHKQCYIQIGRQYCLPIFLFEKND